MKYWINCGIDYEFDDEKDFCNFWDVLLGFESIIWYVSNNL